MNSNIFFDTLRRAALLFAVIGLLATTGLVTAQKTQKRQTSRMTEGSGTDFTGDQLSDSVYYNPASAEWIIHNYDGTVTSTDFGVPEGKPVAADYDSDNIIDIAMVHEDSGMLRWEIMQSGAGNRLVYWGLEGDTPVQGDYDGDGYTDIAVWRASTGEWFILNSRTEQSVTLQLGEPTDKVVPGDYDGDNQTDVAVYHPQDNTFYFIGSGDQLLHSQVWGEPINKRNPTFVPADYDGDGITDFAVFTPRNGEWRILESSSGEFRVESFRVNSEECSLHNCSIVDFAQPGDYDNDGKADPAVWTSTLSSVTAIGSASGSMEIKTKTNVETMAVSAYFMMKY